MLPDEWSTPPLAELSRKPISYGIVQTGEPVAYGVRCIRVVDITKSQINPEDFITTSPEISQSYQRTVLEDGDVILALRGEIGCCLRVTGNLVGCNLTRGLARVAPKHDRVDPSFLTQVLRSPFMQRVFDQKKNGSALQEISIGELRRLPVPLPPLDEQRRIVSVLSTWDRAIALTEKLIAAKRQRKAALMQHLLTGKVRFKRFVRSAETTPTLYGEIPKDWRYLPIAEVAEEVSERNKGGTSHQVLSCTKYDGLVDSLAYFGRQIFSDDLATYKVVRRGQFAYATNHIEEGSIGYQNVCDTAVISPMYTVFKTTDRVDDGFLYKVLKSNLYIHIYQVNTSASVDRRGSLRWSEFSRIRVPVPALDEQRAIAEVIDAQQEEINLQRQKLDALRRQKRGLMQQLLTGKVRVGTDMQGVP